MTHLYQETGMNILQINSSIHSADGQSSRLADRFVTSLLESSPEAELVVRDLAREPIPHLDAERFGALIQKPEARTRAQQTVVDHSDALIEELRRADVLVLGLPMYNFGVPSQLKSWFDHIARAGVTFKYTEQGPVGLMRGRKAYVLAARGGQYAGTAADVQSDYVRRFLAFLGIADVEFAYAEGLAISPETREQGLAGAHEQIESLIAQTVIA